jgi:hypothetical protein
MTRQLRNGRFERAIDPDWDLAKRLFDESRQFFLEHGLDADEAYAMAMTSSELLENAVKYGDWSRATGEQIGFVAAVEGRAVVVEVQSPVADDPAALRKLDDQIQWIRGFQSPFEAYVERLKFLSSLGPRDGQSGLGLIRIAYEARALVDFYVTPSRRLAMSAVYQPEGLLR